MRRWYSPLALAIALAGSLAGCATSGHKTGAVWPPKPETSRIVHVRSFRTPDDLDPGFGRRILSAVLPRDSNAAIQSPFALALSPDEQRLYVVGGATARLVEVNLASRTMRQVVAAGSVAPASAFGVAVDGAGEIYVSDRRAGNVLVYDPEGKFLRRIGQGRLEEPTYLGVDRKRQLLYVVCGSASQHVEHRIEVFSLKGQHLRTLGRRGEAPGEFNFPGSVTVRPDGTLYVADKLNFRVQVFDANGNVIDHFGQLGRGIAGAFDKIRGIAFDTFGNMYIVDTVQGVHILNPKHQALMMFGEPPFSGAPNGIVIDSKNRIFVSDYGFNGVHEFQLVNTTAADSYVEGAPPSAPPPAKTPSASSTHTAR